LDSGQNSPKSKAAIVVALSGQNVMELPFYLPVIYIFHKWAKKQQKSKALTFRPFLATFSIFHKWAKNSKKVRL
jgi:hypothetical protein